MNKLILTDVDGVLLNWENAFDRWMERHGIVRKAEIPTYSLSDNYQMDQEDMLRYIRMFNETVYAGNLSSFRGAVKYVRKAHEELGYTFIAITSMSDNARSHALRQRNLDDLFGRSCFEDVICLPITGACKSNVLSRWKDSKCVWIEDSPKNALIGAEMGFETFLMDAYYNQDVEHENIIRVMDWKHIYEIL